MSETNSSAGFLSTMVIQSSGSCVDINDGSTQAGLGVDEWNCTETSNQSFEFTTTANGYYIIHPQNDNLCLDAGDGSITTGVQIAQTTCSGATSQEWKIIPNSDGSYSIATQNGAGCMDVYDGNSANSTVVTTYACHSASNENFLLAGFAASSSSSSTTPTPGAASTPSSTSPGAFVVPSPGTNSAAPRIFNAPSVGTAGNVISLQGQNLGPNPQVWLAGSTAAAAVPLPIVNSVGTTQLSVQLPATLKGGVIAWVSNGYGASNSVNLNGAIPLHLDALQLVPGGAFRILGSNLLWPGITPAVTVDGLPATVNLSRSNANMLVVTAPPSAMPTSASVIMVDNGNGTGPAQLDRTISVVSGSGDPFALGVGWGAGFTFANHVISVNTPCNGSQDDSTNIQNAITAAANSGGGVVQIPAGNCILANSLSLSSDVVLRGAGKDVTFLIYQSNYPIFANNLDLVGLANFTLLNAGSTQQGMLWKQNTRSFFSGIKINMGVSQQLFLTTNQNMVVSQTDFIQTGSIGEQNPYLFSGSSGLVFSGNTSTSIDGSPTFEAVHDALFLNNHFTRNAANQNESPVIATHMFVMGFAYRISIIGNTFDVINGPITNTTRNDGETLLAEGWPHTENIGTVASATSNSITDPTNTINVNPFGTGLPEDYGVAIVSGTGAGQTRELVGYSGSTMQVDHAWDVIPDSTSHYATFVWGLEKSIIKGNSLLGNPRGIWLYQVAVRDVEILNNTIINGGGIFLRAQQSEANTQFDPMYNVRISGNHISNSDRVWMSYTAAVFVNSDPTAFGIADTGIEIRNNTLTANNPNVTTATEDCVSQEGFMNVMRSQSSGGTLTDSPMLIGTIFQDDKCADCNTAFVIGTGDYGTDLISDLPGIASANFLADWLTLGSASGGSVGTVIH
jgi:hypothetical protein